MDLEGVVATQQLLNEHADWNEDLKTMLRGMKLTEFAEAWNTMAKSSGGGSDLAVEPNGGANRGNIHMIVRE